MKIFLIFSYLIASLASKLCLDYGWVIEWELTDDKIKFTLVIDEKTYETMGYAGLGYQTLEETNGMAGADIDNIMLKEQSICDAYSETNAAPIPDKKLGGNCDITNPEVSPLEYKWEKPLDSGDGEIDHIFKKDAQIRLLWACGLVQDGRLMYHKSEDIGVEIIVLNNDFTSGCESSFLELN